MGDPKNIFTNISGSIPIHLCIILYNQNTQTTKQVAEIIELNLTNTRELLFGIITLDNIIEFEKHIKSIPKNRHPTTQENKTLNILQDILQKKSGVIKFNRKIDSAGQRRLQCSFNKFQNFIINNNNLIIARSNNNIFRGGEITNELISSPRKFNKKRKDIQKL